jgi:hypothetical protein
MPDLCGCAADLEREIGVSLMFGEQKELTPIL